MSIIMNEYDWAEKMISARSLGKHPTETISLVARYYYANHYTKPEILELVERFIIQCNPNASLFAWSGFVTKVVKNASKRPLVKIDYIPITKSELKRIEALKSSQIKRLAFVLLCVSKYWNAVSETNNNWVNTPDREIMIMANVSTSVKRQSAMFNELGKEDMIAFSKRIDNLNVQVLFADDDDEVVMKITDFRNLGYQYMRQYGADCYECECCGVVSKIKSTSTVGSNRRRPPKYCPSCAAEIKIQQTVNSNRRRAASGEN